jgi:3-dehydroquinate synthase
MIVEHSRGQYEIQFIPLAELPEALPADAAIITDENVFNLHRHWIKERPALVLPAGEETKDLKSFGHCLEWLAHRAYSRSSAIVALGGGVIGDLAGFVAASYMRGVPYIQVPTTLLAQVDSSVGGKVGVDLPQGKNLAGAFHPPQRVVICIDSLKTLDHRQFVNGMAEVWKYGFIADEELVGELAVMELDASHPQLEAIVRRCVRHKRDIVQADEYETNGIRATLNFGHTVGHAIEQATNYREYLHGEAISIGMVVEALLGERVGLTVPGTHRVVREHLERQGLPVRSEILGNARHLIEVMKRDKKASRGGLAFSLLTKVGECKLVSGIPEAEVESTLGAL